MFLISLGALLLLVALHLTYKYILKPYLLVQYYKKTGFQAQYFPIVGTFSRQKTNVQKQGEYYAYWVQKTANVSPRPKGFCRNIGDSAMIMLADPHLIKQMFNNKDDFVKHTFQNALVKSLSPNGLVLIEGGLWKRHRKAISEGFSYSIIDQLLPQISKHAKLRIASVKDNEVVGNVFNFFKASAGNIISQVYFHTNLNEVIVDGKPFAICLSDLIADLCGASYSLSYIYGGMALFDLGLLAQHKQLKRRITGVRQAVRTILRRQIPKRSWAKGPETPEFSMWDIFTTAQFTQQEIIDEFITFFSDGVYTTGLFLTMLTYYLARNPKWKQAMLKQFKQNIQQNRAQQNLTQDKFNNSLPIVQACFKETLRLAPPVVTGIERIVVNDYTFSDGTQVKKDTMIMACHLLNHIDPIYHDDPLTFDPSRWLDPESKSNKSVSQHPGIHIPFSIGVRNCPGQKFAMAESTILYKELLQNLDFQIADPGYEIRFTQRFLREPLDPLPIVFKRRV